MRESRFDGGIYGFLVCISIRKWKAKHTHFAT